jgi:SAM-dependent methyltransferase
MCNNYCIEFAKEVLTEKEVSGKKVIDVGSANFNGGFRSIIDGLGPSVILGVDIESGPGVDEICSVYDLVARYGNNSFDVVVCTEMLEHVRDWRMAVSNLKNILKPGGTLILTTRSKGFPYHGYPGDFWRFEIEDMDRIFSDLLVEVNRADPGVGVLLKATKPLSYVESCTSHLNMYSIIADRRIGGIGSLGVAMGWPSIALRYGIASILPRGLKSRLKNLLN